MLASESGTEISLLIRIIDGYFGLESGFKAEEKSSPDFSKKEDLRGAIKNVTPWSLRCDEHQWQEVCEGKVANEHVILKGQCIPLWQYFGGPKTNFSRNCSMKHYNLNNLNDTVILKAFNARQYQLLGTVLSFHHRHWIASKSQPKRPLPVRFLRWRRQTAAGVAMGTHRKNVVIISRHGAQLPSAVTTNNT